MVRLSAHQEDLLVQNMTDVTNRLIASNRIVLRLAKMEPEIYVDDLGELIWEARRYVLAHMSYEVGVRKMAREKWGMVLVEKVDNRRKNVRGKRASIPKALPGPENLSLIDPEVEGVAGL